MLNLIMELEVEAKTNLEPRRMVSAMIRTIFAQEGRDAAFHSTNPLERLNKEIRCRSNVVSVLCNKMNIKGDNQSEIELLISPFMFFNK